MLVNFYNVQPRIRQLCNPLCVVDERNRVFMYVVSISHPLPGPPAVVGKHDARTYFCPRTLLGQQIPCILRSAFVATRRILVSKSNKA